MRMAQIAAPVATAHEVDGRGRLLQFHLEGSHEGVFGHYGHAVARAVDLDADGEFIIGHGGVFLAALFRCEPCRWCGAAFAARTRCSHKSGRASIRRPAASKPITAQRAGMLRPDGRRGRGVISAGSQMTELALAILPETPADADVIERLHERTFGPGRYARTAFRIREGAAHLLDLSFTA